MNSAIVGNGANSYGSLTPSGAVNGAVNGTVNGAVNGTVNGAINVAVNGGVNGAVSGAVNGAVNDVANGAFISAVNGTVSDAVNDTVSSDAPVTQGKTVGGQRRIMTSTTTMTKTSKNIPTNVVRDNFLCDAGEEDLSKRNNRLNGMIGNAF